MSADEHRFAPGKEEIRGLLKLPKDEPFVMINLLKFKAKTADGKSGSRVYNRYSLKVAPLLQKVGGKIVWMGLPKQLMVGSEQDKWDAVVLVEYPRPRAFLEMASSAEYQAIAADRENALEKTALIASKAASL